MSNVNCLHLDLFSFLLLLNPYDLGYHFIMISTKVHHVSINVEDINRSRDFYLSLFSFKVLDRPKSAPEGVWLEMDDKRQLHLILGTTPDDSGQHFALEVSDLDDACDHIRGCGVEIRGPFPNGGYVQAFIHDPDGNRVEINQIKANKH